MIVSEARVATAFGISTAALNTSLVISPLIIAYLQNQDATFHRVELFFVCMTLIALLCAIIIALLDYNRKRRPVSQNSERSQEK